MRSFEARKGFQHTAGFGFGFLAGNSDQYRVSANYRMDWLTSKYYSFVIVNYERGESGGSLFSDKAFVHARVTRDLTDTWIAEVFTQKEFNKMIDLKDRQLLGGGLRYEIRNTDTASSHSLKYVLGMGSGLMYEREITTTPRDKKAQVRSTNYISLNWRLDERISFFSTTYFQPSVQKSSDFRILDETSLSFSINKSLSFLTSFNLRYDDEPPAGIKKYDMAVNNGINVRF